MYYSQWNQDQWLNEHVFKKTKKRVFIDVGAHDGIKFSNTYFFEKNLEWTGICIEPNPKVFEKLQQNRKAKCIMGCAYDQETEIDFLLIEGYSEMLSGINKEYNDQHRQRIDEEIKSQGGIATTIKSKCFRLESIFDENKIIFADYITIDTEGSELNVLKGIDFQKIVFCIIDVEINYKEDEKKITDFLREKNYIYITTIGGDNIYANKMML